MSRNREEMLADFNAVYERGVSKVLGRTPWAWARLRGFKFAPYMRFPESFAEFLRLREANTTGAWLTSERRPESYTTGLSRKETP